MQLDDNEAYSNETTLLKAILGEKLLIIGHRGLGVSSVLDGRLPENTIPSLRMAFFDGADMVELDVTLTWDGHVIVFHDDRLHRTTNGLGNIQNHKLDTIRVLDAGVGTDWQGKSIKLPTLREVFFFILKEDMHHALNIELKPYAGSQRQSYNYRRLLVQEVHELVQEFEVADRIIFSSFDWRILLLLKQTNPKYISALLAQGEKWSLHKMIQCAKMLRLEGIHPHFNLIRTREEMQKAKEAGLFVQPYGLNTMDEFYRAQYLGVSGIITDYPEKLKNFLKR